MCKYGDNQSNEPGEKERESCRQIRRSQWWAGSQKHRQPCRRSASLRGFLQSVKSSSTRSDVKSCTFAEADEDNHPDDDEVERNLELEIAKSRLKFGRLQNTRLTCASHFQVRRNWDEGPEDTLESFFAGLLQQSSPESPVGETFVKCHDCQGAEQIG